MIIATNPATGKEIARYRAHDEAFIDQALAAAVTAQRDWRKRIVAERVKLLLDLAKVLRGGRARYAEMITREMGKPIVESEAEIDKCAYNCEYYAEHADGFLADEMLSSNATESRVAFDPLGVVLAIMPWNYPFWQFFPLRCACACSGQRCHLEARQQRAGMRARDPRDHDGSRMPSRAVQHVVDRRIDGCQGHYR